MMIVFSLETHMCINKICLIIRNYSVTVLLNVRYCLIFDSTVINLPDRRMPYINIINKSNTKKNYRFFLKWTLKGVCSVYPFNFRLGFKSLGFKFFVN